MDDEQDLGVPASPSGSQASPGAARAPPPPVSIPNAAPTWKEATAPIAGLPLEKRFQFATLLVTHHTESIKFAAKQLQDSREGLLAAMELLDGVLSEVERVASDPFASAIGCRRRRERRRPT